MGRTATGVKGIELDKKDHVIDHGSWCCRKSTLLVVTEKGWASAPSSGVPDFSTAAAAASSPEARSQDRRIVALKEVLPTTSLMMITKKGIIIRSRSRASASPP